MAGSGGYSASWGGSRRAFFRRGGGIAVDERLDTADLALDLLDRLHQRRLDLAQDEASDVAELVQINGGLRIAGASAMGG
jgi:hypothetical protein